MEKGDLVKHKAGELKMVVTFVSNTGVICEWVDPSGHPHKNVFTADVLEPWMDPPVTPAPGEPPTPRIVGQLPSPPDSERP